MSRDNEGPSSISEVFDLPENQSSLNDDWLKIIRDTRANIVASASMLPDDLIEQLDTAEAALNGSNNRDHGAASLWKRQARTPASKPTDWED